MAKITKEAALLYHSQGKPGKIEVVPTKPYSTQTDLSLAYSPGVAEPCLEIEKNPQDAYKYTAKGNLVAVISNGTAVLGLGDIGALSGKPVMEGKGLLFKIYAGIDVFDIEVDEKDPEKFIAAVKAIASCQRTCCLQNHRIQTASKSDSHNKILSIFAPTATKRRTGRIPQSLVAANAPPFICINPVKKEPASLMQAL